LRRAVRYGDGWHPMRLRVDWLRNEGLPQLRKIAESEGKPMPAICPRIKLRLTDSPLPDNIRLAGEGTLDQVRSDLEDLAYLGAEYVLLDTYTGQPGVAQENDQAMYSLLADKVLRLS
jgi:hypothetical protein